MDDASQFATLRTRVCLSCMHRVRALSSAQSLLSTAVRCTQRTRLPAPRSQTQLRRSLTRTPVAMSGEPAAAAGALPLQAERASTTPRVSSEC